MNPRELITAIWAGQPVDRLPMNGIWPWGETMERWRREGMPEGVHPASYLEILSDRGCGLPLNLNMVPPFPIRILQMGDDYVTLVDEFGVTKKVLRTDYDRSGGYKGAAGAMSSMSHWLDFPVKDLRSWKAIYEERFQPTLAGRLPDDWQQKGRAAYIEESKARWASFFCFPLCGLFGPMREMMGVEGLAYVMADDPGLIRTIVGDLVAFWLETFAKVLDGEVRLDQTMFFEDMCATKAPMIGPAGFRGFMASGYSRFIGGMREMGVKEFWVDTDGNAWSLLPELIACGVTGISPCEAQADMDVVRLREAFPTLNLAGGIAKRALVEGPAAIDAELRRCFTVAWQKGRYTPSLDHGAPPDIPWKHAMHYAEGIKKWSKREGFGL